MAAAVTSQQPQQLPVVNSSDIKGFESKYSKEKITPSYFKIFASYVQKGSGPYNFFKLLKDGCKWPILYAREFKLTSEVVGKFFKTQTFFNVACKGLIATKIPTTIVDLHKSYEEYKVAKDKDTTRKRDKFAKKTVEIVADTSTFLQLGEIIGIYTLGSIIGPAASFAGSLFLLFQHMITFKMDREDFIAHSKEKKEINDNKRLLTLFHEAKNLDLLKLTKSVVSIALSIFLVAEFVFSVSFLSPAVLLFLSTATTVLAIWSHFYQESMTYPYKC